MRTFQMMASLSAAILLAWASPVLASFGNNEVEVPQDSLVFFVDETKLPFDEVPGLPAEQFWGVDAGAGYRSPSTA